MWFGVTVRDPQVGDCGSTRMVAVLDQLAGLVRACTAKVDGHHRLDTGLATPGDELVRSELVGLGRKPSQVEPDRTLLLRANTITPVVAGHEVSTRPAHDGDAELLRQFQHVPAKSVFVRRRVAGLVDAAVHAASEMLDECAENAAVQTVDDEIAIGDQTGLWHGYSPGSEALQYFIGAPLH